METLKKQSLFWDVDLESLDPQKHKKFIVKRILERGDLEDFLWAKVFYGLETIRQVFQKYADRLDAKSRVFWAINLDLK